MDDLGPWGWPLDTSDKLKVLNWMISLNQEFDMQELTNISVGNESGNANHWVSIDSLNNDALQRLNGLLKETKYFQLVENRIFSIRYCYRPNTKQRLICTIGGEIIYPIWWDPTHATYGEKYERQTSGLCDDFGCHHF
jgi:hypothetical protein